MFTLQSIKCHVTTEIVFPYFDLLRFVISRVAYRYSGTDRNRDLFRKVPVFYRFIENRY